MRHGLGIRQPLFRAQHRSAGGLEQHGSAERIAIPAMRSLERERLRRVNSHTARSVRGKTLVVTVKEAARHRLAEILQPPTPSRKTQRDSFAAHAATCARDLKPSLLSMCLTCTSTVPSVLTSASAMSRLLRPTASNRATSHSRLF